MTSKEFERIPRNTRYQLFALYKKMWLLAHNK